MPTVSKTEIDSFRDKGYLKLEGVFDKIHVQKIQEEIWEELEEEFGIRKDDRNTWSTPSHSPRKAKFSETDKLLINDHFLSIINELLGKKDWDKPNSWGGYNVNFPSPPSTEWSLTSKLWHWDYELFRQPELGGLLVFSFFSKVQPKGGGTLAVEGSHHAIRNYDKSLSHDQRAEKHGQHRKHFMSTHTYFKKLTDPSLSSSEVSWFMDEVNVVEDVPLKVVEFTGDLGDVVFCHPRLVHAPAGVNLNDYPRIMRTKFLW